MTEDKKVSSNASKRWWQSLSCVASKLKTFVVEYVRDSKSSGLLYWTWQIINMVRLCSTKVRSGSSSCWDCGNLFVFSFGVKSSSSEGVLVVHG